MATAQRQRRMLSCLLLITSFFSPSLARSLLSDTPTAYEMLERFNFPKGILPEGVRSYVLRQDGSFEVLLSSDCEFKVDGGYLLKYKKVIAGKVESGALNDLKGVSVKVLFAWFTINSVARSDADLSFYVGPLSASFPLTNFEDSPQCGCGFDCAVVAAAKLSANS